MLYRSRDESAWDARYRVQLEYAARGLELGVSTGRDYLGAAGYANAVWLSQKTSGGKEDPARPIAWVRW